MLNKIRNWLEEIRLCLYGSSLLFLALCAVAFGGAYLGMNTATRNNKHSETFFSTDELCEQDCD